MPTVTIVDRLPKATTTQAAVLAERDRRRTDPGVVSCEMGEDAADWLLTTQYDTLDTGLAQPTTQSPAPVVPAAPPAVPPAGAAFGTLVPGGFFSSDPDAPGVPRSIRTNNPGALNFSSWQLTRPGFIGETGSDGSADNNRTTIYRTPEHGVASWFHLLANIYGFDAARSFTLVQLAQHYAGRADGPLVQGYLKAWPFFSGGALTLATVINSSDDTLMLTLGRAMFANEIGHTSPLHDDQIAYGITHGRDGVLPP